MKKKLVLFCLVLLIVFVASSFIIANNGNGSYTCLKIGCPDTGGACEDGYAYATCSYVVCVGGATVNCDP